jgi:sugar lactone lactonase YvrE
MPMYQHHWMTAAELEMRKFSGRDIAAAWLESKCWRFPERLIRIRPSDFAQKRADMTAHQLRLPYILTFTLVGIFAFAFSPSFAEESEIALPGDRAYPESISAAPDNTLYVGSLATGGVWRIKPDTGTVEQWIKPGAFGTRLILGVLVDEKANLLWVCSNDFSSRGIPGPSSVPGSFVKGFDLTSGDGKVSAELPSKAKLCNDMVVGTDGSLFVTNSLAPQILKLKPGSNELEVWLESQEFEQPPQGAPGLDGIAFGGDGNLYVNTFANGNFFRVDVKDGAPGKITKLKPSRPLKLPDGLRSTGGLTFVMAEGGGSADRLTVDGDQVDVETIMDGIAGPTSVAVAGRTLWITEGQLPHLFELSKNGPPHLPFRIIGIPIQSTLDQNSK